MKRTIDKELIKWKDSLSRLPLIVRGARQVGKSYAIEQFGKTSFENLIVVNFEKRSELAGCFVSLDPKEIINRLNYYFDIPIKAGTTLLFLDEIQLCPQALQSLRYFCEEIPDLHVIAAGSLLEFILEEENFSFPVGRVQFAYMKPLSFMEYLEALNKSILIEIISHATIKTPPDEQAHSLLLKHLHDYFLIGGMPKVVDLYRQNSLYLDCLHRQRAIFDVYRLDFGKYAKKTQHYYLQRLFERAPEIVGKHFKYSKIDPESPNPARDYKTALKKLTQANLVSIVYETSANGLPLRAEIDDKKFKVFFLDIGLLMAGLELDPSLFQAESLEVVNKGVLAEQFVGQELMAYSDVFLDKHLYYWEETKASSSAEIDFVLSLSGKIVPIEVKAGATGKLKSLHQFLERKNIDVGIQVSEKCLQFEGKILSVPFYLLSKLTTLLQEARTNK